MISPENFATLFDDNYPKLYAYIRTKVADQATAEDITATAFERAFSRGQTFDPGKGSFTTWLFRIARNLVIDNYTAARRKPELHDLKVIDQVATPDLSPEQQLIRRQQHQYLLGAISILSERDQEIVRLRFFGRLTNREIAGLMALKEKTVSVIIYRALKKLRNRLELEAAR